MTFYEAAVEVLRSAGRPLHVKKITAISVEQNLLTHVGRDPEKTMRARLSQEVAKTGESLIKIIRPNVYVLRDGANPDSARQTVQPRKVDADADDHLTAHASQEHARAESARQTEQDARSNRKSSDDRTHDDARNSRKNDDNARSQSTSKSTRTQRGKDDTPRHQDKARTNDKPRAQEPRKSKPQRESAKPTGPRIAPSPAAQKLADLREHSSAPARPKAGDLAAHIHDILQSAPADGLSLKDIGKKLSDTAYAALPKLPLQALRSTLLRANQRRADKGQPPLFTNNTDGRWSLIQEDTHLTASLDVLEQWQERHKALLARRLEHVIDERSDEQLLGVVALVMERLGYEGVELHPAEGEEIATFSATLTHGLSQSRVAVRVFSVERPITRLDIMAFRGNLHQYQAERGTIFTLGGHSLCAREQIDAPNAAPVTLLQGNDLAELMIRTHVGTTEVKVSVPHLDHAFFD